MSTPKHRPIKEAQIKRMIEDTKREVAAELAALDGSEDVAILVDDLRAWGPSTDPVEEAERKELIAESGGKPLVGTFPLNEALQMAGCRELPNEGILRPGMIPIIYHHGDTFTVMYAVPSQPFTPSR